MEYVTLNNGVKMPMAGIGTFLLQPDDAEASVLAALKSGYKLIDTANAYMNEKAVGRGMKRSGLAREEIFLETKLWPSFYEQKNVVDKTLKRLNTDYIDLLLLHQPAGNYIAGYRLMEKAYKEGKVRAIGLSKQPAFSLHPKYLTLNVLPSILSLGMPLACSTLLMSVSNVISNNMMIEYGTVALAAQGVAGKAGMLLSVLLMGICMGLQPAISFNHARGNRERVGQIIRSTAIFTALLGSVISLLCFLFRQQILALFIDNSEVIAYGSVMIFASIVIGPFYGIYQLCQTFLQATGKASYATLVALMDKGIFYLPVLLLMHQLFGMCGIVFSSAVTLLFSIAAGVFLSLRWNRRLTQDVALRGEG